MPALVIQFLLPLITHSSPSRTAVVRIEAGSEPASGSERQNAGDHSPDAHLGSQLCFCSSVPKSWIGSVPSSCTIKISALEAQALATSSIAMLELSTAILDLRCPDSLPSHPLRRTHSSPQALPLLAALARPGEKIRGPRANFEEEPAGDRLRLRGRGEPYDRVGALSRGAQE